MSRLPFNAFDLRVGQDLNITVPACIDQLRGHDTHGTVVGGKRLVQLSHGSADAQAFFEEIDLEPRFSEVQGGLDSSDPSAHDEHGAHGLLPGGLYLFMSDPDRFSPG
jgi:hypothetical protein